MSELRVGVSGWAYPEWRGVVYPKGLVQKRELEFLGKELNSIEINGTFYSLQTPKSFQKWSNETPDDLLFAVKGSKFITHQKKLKDVEIPLANFFASGLLCLGRKFGPLLWQFSPWLKFDAGRIETFLKLLPRTAAEAAKLAQQNTIKKPNGAFVELIEDVPLRYAFEPRHESFFVEEFVEMLRKYDMALAFADTAEKFGYFEDVTADFIYIRLHGDEELYVSDYRDAELDRWARRIKAWQEGSEPKDAKKITKVKPRIQERDVYVYFDNSMEGHAFFDAKYLAEKLGVQSKSPAK
ncbi:MAG TPA: DUF72 domain-containing protein [Pyrinomonadaceae bacterium]|jgi:uncharacterized protein YecE (DUF72 family)|nr:DUF72 domain-containing protein [Pyrinomonadaceae bacterium]